MALSVEASELVELFQWLTRKRARRPTPIGAVRVADELADVLWFLVRIADRLDIDLLEAAGRKLAANAEKYPVDRVRGDAAQVRRILKGDATPSVFAKVSVPFSR